MHVVDYQRSKLYGATLNQAVGPVVTLIHNPNVRGFFTSPERMSDGIAESLADRLDSLVLPVVAREVRSAHESALLRGRTGHERYDSFFEQEDGKHSILLRNLVKQYPLLFETTKRFAESAVKNTRVCIERLIRDWKTLQDVFSVPESDRISTISFLGSDRHNGGQEVLLLEFESGRKIVYKPKLFSSDIFRSIIAALELDSPYDVALPVSVYRPDYYWEEYIPCEFCDKRDEVRLYWRRAGVLLAVADAVHFIDGNQKNLIARRSYPLLIDDETLFHPLAGVIRQEERSLFTTGFLRREADILPLKSGKQAFVGGFQALGNYVFRLQIYPENERTENVKARYEGLFFSPSKNCPVLEGRYQSSKDYQEEFIDGFRHGYNRITERMPTLFKDTEFVDTLKRCTVRFVLRQTKRYIFLLNELIQPHVCVSENRAREVLRNALKADNDSVSDDIVEYEIQRLLNFDIPLFYHRVGGRDIIDGEGRVYCGVLPNSSFDELEGRLRERSESKREEDVAFIRLALSAAPDSCPLE